MKKSESRHLLFIAIPAKGPPQCIIQPCPTKKNSLHTHQSNLPASFYTYTVQNSDLDKQILVYCNIKTIMPLFIFVGKGERAELKVELRNHLTMCLL